MKTETAQDNGHLLNMHTENIHTKPHTGYIKGQGTGSRKVGGESRKVGGERLVKVCDCVSPSLNSLCFHLSPK